MDSDTSSDDSNIMRPGIDAVRCFSAIYEVTMAEEADNVTAATRQKVEQKDWQAHV